jgi:predicted nucleic acid-binding protein
MILVDSSAWIEFYRSSGNPGVAGAVARAIEEDAVCTNGIIQAEIVSFAPDRKSFEQLTADFKAFHWLEFERKDFDLASKMGLDLRRRGVTAPATDLTIAACAIHAGAMLYHLDSHFDQIAKHTRLKAVHLEKSA